MRTAIKPIIQYKDYEFYVAEFEGIQPTRNIKKVLFEDLPSDIQDDLWKDSRGHHAGLGPIALRFDPNMHHTVYFGVYKTISGFNYTTFNYYFKDPYEVAQIIPLFMSASYATQEQKDIAKAAAENYWYDRD